MLHRPASSGAEGAPRRPQPAIVQVVGYKNTGKTTLVCRLTESLKKAAYRVATIKHDAHDFQMDTPGTDSWRHQQAGADMTAIVSPARTAILKRQADSLEELIDAMDGADIILIEGFKQAPYPKLLLLRSAADLRLAKELQHVRALVLWPQAATLAAVQDMLASEPLRGVPRFDIDDVEAILQSLLHDG